MPAATARLWSADMTAMIFIAMANAALAAAIGLVLSYHASLSTGPTIILVAGLFYVVSLLVGRSGGLLADRTRPRHLEA